MYMELSVKRRLSSVIVHDHSFRVDFKLGFKVYSMKKKKESLRSG